MAANPHKGEVDLTVGDTTYTLAFTNNSIVLIEQLFGGIGIGAIASDFGRVEYVRGLLWGALQKHHPKIDLMKTGDLLDDIEGLPAVADPLARALRFRLARIPVDAPLVIEKDGE